MITRMSDIELKFPQDCDLESRIELDFEFMLNSEPIFKEIKKLQYKQVKVPNAPSFLAEECLSDSNEPAIILSWHQKIGNKNNLQGYVLEVDDGTNDGQFKQVYYGSDSICKINGLVPDLVYNARVKAFNQAGFSEYSHVISVPSTPSNNNIFLQLHRELN
jgi:tripartite motif-containing protein 9/67